MAVFFIYFAATGVGASGASGALETAVSSLAVATTTGDIDIINTGNVELAGATTTASDITITAVSSITVTAAVTTTESGNILLDAQGAGGGHDISVQAAISSGTSASHASRD